MTEQMVQAEHIATAEAARALATTETRVLMLLKQKALEGCLLEGEWFVTKASLAGYDKEAATQSQTSHCNGCSSSRCGCN